MRVCSDNPSRRQPLPHLQFQNAAVTRRLSRAVDLCSAKVSAERRICVAEGFSRAADLCSAKASAERRICVAEGFSRAADLCSAKASAERRICVARRLQPSGRFVWREGFSRALCPSVHGEPEGHRAALRPCGGSVAVRQRAERAQLLWREQARCHATPERQPRQQSGRRSRI